MESSGDSQIFIEQGIDLGAVQVSAVMALEKQGCSVSSEQASQMPGDRGARNREKSRDENGRGEKGNGKKGNGEKGSWNRGKGDEDAEARRRENGTEKGGSEEKA